MRSTTLMVAVCLLGGTVALGSERLAPDTPLSSCDAYIRYGTPEAGRECVATLTERESALDERERRLLDHPREGSVAAAVRDLLAARHRLEEELRTLRSQLEGRAGRLETFLKTCVAAWREERDRRDRAQATAATAGGGRSRAHASVAGGSARGRTQSSVRDTTSAGSNTQRLARPRVATGRQHASSVRQNAPRSTDTVRDRRTVRSAAVVPRSRGTGPVVLVVDVSNSMTESFGRGTKFDVMHAAARLLADALDDGRAVGLTVFGTGADCGAVRTLVPPRPGALPSVRSVLRGLQANPLGNTPLTTGLEAGIRSAGKGHEVTVLLLSDGGENCGRDPVSTLLRLRTEGYRFRIHAVAFERMYAPRVIMATIANLGRGQFVQFRPDEDVRRRLARLLDELRR